MLPENGNSGQRLKRGNVARTGHDDIRIAILIVAGPGPYANAFGAMLHGGIHAQPLGGGMFSGNDHIDVMSTAQTMVHDRKQTIGIRWQINSDNLRLFVDDVVDKTRILMSEAVVVLPPHMRSEQVIERRESSAPRELGCDFQPFCMLVEHGIHDMDECFVAVE